MIGRDASRLGALVSPAGARHPSSPDLVANC